MRFYIELTTGAGDRFSDSFQADSFETAAGEALSIQTEIQDKLGHPDARLTLVAEQAAYDELLALIHRND